jgi:hypothetical protein
MLLFVIGEQSRNSHKAAHFSKTKNIKKQHIQARVAAMVNLGLSWQDFNNLIDNRSSNSHCANLKQLVKRVKEAKEAFEIYPDLKSEMPKEFFLCENFYYIRSHILCLPF